MKIFDGTLTYRKGIKKIEVPVSDFVWGYIQLEDVHSHMCCGGFDTVIGRVFLLDKNGIKHTFQYEGREKADSLLSEISSLNPSMAVGYTDENKKKFLL